ncbi:MAG: hypothetical protein SF182_00395 [Deltaproteobacteria bacterium]|nr:hypothetical protein [Deltaproteobacteria bacterium]
MRLAIVLLGLLAAGAASAQCAGDCNGDGEVRVEDMILGVRIALGELPVDACAAFDLDHDGTVGIAELVSGAGALLNGCPVRATPTGSPTPSPSASATASDTETPSPTPTIPAVAGAWREAPLVISDSTCLPVFTDFLGAQFAARGACDQAVVATGETTVRVTDCSAQAVDGTVSRDGTIELVFPPATANQDGCELTLDVRSSIPAASSPTTAAYVFDLAFGGACDALEDCSVNASGEWTRVP